MTQKFNVGNKVRIINYGHVSWVNEDLILMDANIHNRIMESMDAYIMLGKEMSDEMFSSIPDRYTSVEDLGIKILDRDNNWLTVDDHPEYVGEVGVIIGITRSQNGSYEYSIFGTTKQSWFYEDQIELI